MCPLCHCTLKLPGNECPKQERQRRREDQAERVLDVTRGALFAHERKELTDNPLLRDHMQKLTFDSCSAVDYDEPDTDYWAWRAVMVDDVSVSLPRLAAKILS
jgi:hypothetical protein